MGEIEKLQGLVKPEG